MSSKMANRLRQLLEMTFLSLITTTSLAAIEVIDDEGTLVQLEQPASRIVSLAPSLTEMLFAINAGDKIVGVVEFSDFPPAAASLPVIGRHDLIDLEAIVALQPDLVVSWKSGNPSAAIERLRQLGLTVYVAEPRELQNIPTHLERLAILAGTEKSAHKVSEQFTATLRQLRATYSGQSGVRVFYQVWDSPLITAGGNELINDMITLCGGLNIFADLSLMAPKVDTESVLARNPQVIIASGMDIARPEWLDNWRDWPQMEAVAAGHLYFIPPDLVQRHTPRALTGVSQMCEQINRARSH